jgi:hypothetical protein
MKTVDAILEFLVRIFCMACLIGGMGFWIAAVFKAVQGEYAFAGGLFAAGVVGIILWLFFGLAWETNKASVNDGKKLP